MKYFVLSITVIYLVASPPSLAQPKYDTGATDTEIKIGNIMPYSGPASSFGVIGKTEAAFFAMINEEGGINGRKIKFISYDDAYSPPKAVEQARKLVESDEVLLLFNTLGTPSNAAIQKYLNVKKVPHLFVASGASKWGDPSHFPWTMGWQPSYASEALIYAKYILTQQPNAKIAMLSGTDDAAKDWTNGVRRGLGDRSDMIVSEKTFEVTDPVVDSQIVALKSSGADVLFVWASPKAAAQAIRKVAELGWRPQIFLPNASSSIAAVLKPAGLENSKGIISTAFLKDPTDPRWDADRAMQDWRSFLDKYYPEADRININTVFGYAVAQTVVEVLKRCGDDLTRANVMKQAASLRGFPLNILLPGIKIDTSDTDFYPIEQMQIVQFNGVSWQSIGDIIEGKPSQ
jgi:ABC-type branched-subunit amino acid transport system substrate-binding protein